MLRVDPEIEDNASACTSYYSSDTFPSIVKRQKSQNFMNSQKYCRRWFEISRYWIWWRNECCFRFGGETDALDLVREFGEASLADLFYMLCRLQWLTAGFD